ncbi:lysoplasmalogenase [Eisenibacter elegans]|jgi:uncharacterized membrane protein YhhN|uniref:lysoplasmalogenase n=1 Tax=Eisenibacter elegans TaxID=997 RepID=UPI0004017098|nr:lysoplasmalogenase [Eisenibacter elegans]
MLFFWLYCAAAVLNLSALATAHPFLEYVSKPLLMVFLGIHFYQGNPFKANPTARWVMLALLGSWGGDVLLLFAKHDSAFFIGGLSSFLFAHLAYIQAYRYAVGHSSEPSLLGRKPWLYVPFMLLYLTLYGYLYPHLGAMQIPVAVYALAIVGMSLAALNRFRLTSPQSFQLVFGGALLFMLSDTCIALNKFVQPFEAAGIVIMSTYIIAQYLIVRGILIHLKAQMTEG